MNVFFFRIVCIYKFSLFFALRASGGELQTLLDNDEIPEEKVVKRFMRQILDGLEFLHSVNVAHLDIKVNRKTFNYYYYHH